MRGGSEVLVSMGSEAVVRGVIFKNLSSENLIGRAKIPPENGRIF